MKPFVIPAYLEAKSKDELRKLMLHLQLKLKLKIVFYDIQFAENKWVCWYEVPVNLSEEFE
jgi:hypothetical protein